MNTDDKDRPESWNGSSSSAFELIFHCFVLRVYLFGDFRRNRYVLFKIKSILNTLKHCKNRLKVDKLQFHILLIGLGGGKRSAGAPVGSAPKKYKEQV